MRRLLVAVAFVCGCNHRGASDDTTGDPSTSAAMLGSSDTTSLSPTSVADGSTSGAPEASSSGSVGSEGGSSESTGSTHDGVAMFVTAGYGFRRAMSCDDGLTWIAQQVEDPAGGDDDTLARGLGYGDGRFVAAVGGGGSTGAIWTSDDGTKWTQRVAPGMYNGFSEAVWGEGHHVAGGGHVSIRSSDGITWGEPGTMGEGGILRHLEFGAGWFVAVGGDRVQRSDDGVVWAPPDSGSCSGEYLGLVFGNDAFVAIDAGGHVCRSIDGGASWNESDVDAAWRGLAFSGTSFVATGFDDVWRSDDGVAWTPAGQGGGPELMAASDAGTMVGVAGETFFRSSDGGASWIESTT